MTMAAGAHRASVRPTARVIAAAGCLAAALGGAILAAAAAQESVVSPTFADIAPLLRERCGSCHRPGGSTPMALLTYADARPWARSIGRAVESRAMPPWLPSGPRDRFAGDRRLRRDEIELLSSWVAGGAREGDRLPPPTAATDDGWML